MRTVITSIIVSLIVVLGPQRSAAQSEADIMVLGDSQISFGAGAVYLEFFENLAMQCQGTDFDDATLSKLGDQRTAALGVRSTSLHSWVARKGASKGTICDVDKKYGVNAGVYGLGGNPKRKFVQVGRDTGVKFCRPNQSAFEGLFREEASNPKLLILAFLGNAAERWTDDPGLATQDVRRTLDQVPTDVPCVFMSTVPVYSKKTNDLRMKAQTEIVNAFRNSGGRCEVVEGFSTATRNAIEGHARFFKRNSAGRVTDPHHPSPAATRMFVDLNRAALCNAIAAAVD